jgi:hypothetical protein
MTGIVTAVSRGATHTFSKAAQASIRLMPGLGLEDDAHMGGTVKHRSRVAHDPNQPNLRQVHLTTPSCLMNCGPPASRYRLGRSARMSPRVVSICSGCRAAPGCT